MISLLGQFLQKYIIQTGSKSRKWMNDNTEP